MEKSHHQAKAAYQAHTAHGGGKARTSAILQQFQHWYRNIQHRYRKKMEIQGAVPDPDAGARALAASRRRERWQQSNAAIACKEWRSRRRRVGGAYVLEEVVEGEGDGMMEEEPEWIANGDMVGSGGEEDEQRDAANNDEDIADAGNRGAGEDIAPDVDIAHADSD